MTEEQLRGIVTDNFYMMRTILSNTKDILDSLCENDVGMERLRTPWMSCYVSIISLQSAADELFNKEEEE